MSIRYVLDTDAVVDVLRGRYGVSARLAAQSPDDVAIASMTLAELLYGARCSHDPAKSELAVRRFVEVVRVLPFTRRAAGIHARIREATKHKTVGPNDLVIAATTLAAGAAAIVTANHREFGRVEGLAVESWR
jgi:tRNA(fMet)-specific endonuclease VapC